MLIPITRRDRVSAARRIADHSSIIPLHATTATRPLAYADGFQARPVLPLPVGLVPPPPPVRLLPVGLGSSAARASASEACYTTVA